jgi:hypothetical protein
MSRASCAFLLAYLVWRMVVNTAQVSQVREGLCGLLLLLLLQCVLWYCMHRCYAMYLFTKVADYVSPTAPDKSIPLVCTTYIFMLVA